MPTIRGVVGERLSAARAVPKEFRRMPQPPGEEGQGQQRKGYQREQERHGSNSLQQSLLAPEQRHNTRWKVAENQHHKASPLYQEQRLGEAAAPAKPGRHLRVYVGKGSSPVLLLLPIKRQNRLLRVSYALFPHKVSTPRLDFAVLPQCPPWPPD